MIKFSNLALVLVVASLAGCTGLTGGVFMAGDAAGILATKPSTPPPADTEHQIAEHESWCYTTMGDIECFDHIQNVQPERLVNVEPQNRYPLNAKAYHDEVTRKPLIVADAVSVDAPVILEPAPINAAVEKTVLSPPVIIQKDTVPQPHITHKVHKRKKKHKAVACIPAQAAVPKTH